jgi:hypothetical protein
MSDHFPWILACEALFVVVAVFFVWTALRRHRMDLAIKLDGTQTSFSTAPERRWTYDHDYMVRYIETLCRRVPVDAESTYWLNYYAGPILKLDIAFAVSFATFIVFASILIACHFGPSPWLLRVSFVTAGMGVVYGFADVAEDLKLQSILRNAAVLQANKISDTPDELETGLADAAEVDAANALTRMKIVTITLSLVGMVAFAVLQGLAALAILLSSQPSDGPKPQPQR